MNNREKTNHTYSERVYALKNLSDQADVTLSTTRFLVQSSRSWPNARYSSCQEWSKLNFSLK